MSTTCGRRRPSISESGGADGDVPVDARRVRREIQDICAIVHEHGGQVYMDGANMNAQVGLTSPAAIGADVCHLNLHKTFCDPARRRRARHGPDRRRGASGAVPARPSGREGWRRRAIHAVSAAPWGSASILLISYGYIRMLGGDGMTEATRVAILNANYIAQSRLEPHYPVLYAGANGRVAHELIFDLRPFKQASGIDVDDVAKRLMDYGFHAPTVSFPVAGHADGRADRERAARGTRSVLRGDDRDSRGDSGGQRRRGRPSKTTC